MNFWNNIFLFWAIEIYLSDIYFSCSATNFGVFAQEAFLKDEDVDVVYIHATNLK